MRKLFNGSNGEKLILWRKVSFYFNIIGAISIFLAFYFKRILLPYRVVVCTYLIVLVLIGFTAALMATIIRRKMRLK